MADLEPQRDPIGRLVRWLVIAGTVPFAALVAYEAVMSPWDWALAARLAVYVAVPPLALWGFGRVYLPATQRRRLALDVVLTVTLLVVLASIAWVALRSVGRV